MSNGLAWRQITMLVSQATAAQLKSFHAELVDDATKTGQTAPTFSDFLTNLLMIGCEAVKATVAVPAPAPPDIAR